MLTNKAKQLIDLSEEKLNLRKSADRIESFKTRQQQIEKAVLKLLPLVDTLRVFRQKNIIDCSFAQKVEPTLQFINKSITSFTESPEWIAESRDFDGDILERSIKAITTELDKQLTQAWNSYLAEKMPSTNQEMLNVLVKIAAFRSTVQSIQNLNDRIQRQKIPQTFEEFEYIEQLINQLRECWHSLSSDAVPETVLHFLKAAVDLGASLHLLTPEVHEWLDSHGISDSLRIRLT